MPADPASKEAGGQSSALEGTIVIVGQNSRSSHPPHASSEILNSLLSTAVLRHLRIKCSETSIQNIAISGGKWRQSVFIRAVERSLQTPMRSASTTLVRLSFTRGRKVRSQTTFEHNAIYSPFKQAHGLLTTIRMEMLQASRLDF